jgi:hypothetical protein
MIDTKEKIMITDLRDSLKRVIQNELIKLPEQLEVLEPKERLNVVCKLMPYVFPRVDTVHLKEGEPFTFD